MTVTGTKLTRTLFVFLAASALRADSLQDLVTRLDRAASDFRSMSAELKVITHTAVINSDDEETGTMMMKKVQGREVQYLLDFSQPDPRTIFYEKKKVQIYLPKIKTVQIYDLGKHSERLEQFLMLGFGTSGTELAGAYDMQAAGSETMDGKPTTRLVLVPKAADLRSRINKVEMWIPDGAAPYPVEQKFYQPAGDYRRSIYSNLKINPSLGDKLKLKLPGGVKTEYPQK
jgi:outer membrane lipoprotein-sorting protein